ncbi:MAG: fumarylacetoacetate hydrolase family protein [Gammaproteobacteria bacterium]|nr:fumarylacetoacetate hydrolase family protein [Gammaproteobacteria bacterium]
MNNLAADLWHARQNGELVDTTDFPGDPGDAYALQADVDRVSGAEICGFKIGATATATMDMLGVDEPFYGPLYRQYCRNNGDAVPVFALHGPKVETEFVIGIEQPLSANGSRTADDIKAVTGYVAGGFEIIGNRFKTTPDKRGYCAIADFGANVDFILGDKITDWQDLNLDAHPVTLFANDEEITSGHSGMSIAGNPFGMVAWLINQPGFDERGLKPGDLITCGTCSGIHAVAAGDVLRAEFGELGTLGATITDASGHSN